METLYLIGLGALLGTLATYCGMRLVEYQRKKEADQKQKEAALLVKLEEVTNELTNLQNQLKGKQLPYFIRDGLEEVKALENADAFDLARMRLYLEEAIKTVDQAAERQTKIGAVYSSMRNHRKKEG